MSDDQAIFIDTIRADDSLPHSVRERADEVQGLERRNLDVSYLDFLREQIALEARGAEWTAILSARIAALSPFCDVPTLSGRIDTPTGSWSIRVEPSSRRVIHSEEHEAIGDLSPLANDTVKRPRLVIPLEDIVMPILFIVITVIGIATCQWIGLSFWVACLLGGPASWLFVMGLVWLLSRASGPRQ